MIKRRYSRSLHHLLAGQGELLCRRYPKKQGIILNAKSLLILLREPTVEVPSKLVDDILKAMKEANVGQKRLAKKICKAAGLHVQPRRRKRELDPFQQAWRDGFRPVNIPRL